MRRGTSINLRFVRNCSEKGKRAGTVGLYGLGQEFVRKYESGSKSFRNRYCLGHTFIIQFSGENVPKYGSLCSTFIYTKIDRECSKNTKIENFCLTNGPEPHDPGKQMLLAYYLYLPLVIRLPKAC